ncbi:MAG: META domain-containing protein [Burkholderiaceae bacterium]|nr:META domain-containing protein [Burkholderiaceae bacterium]
MHFRLVIALAAALVLGACAQGVATRADSGTGASREERPTTRPERPQPPAERAQPLVVRGTMAYRERIALPPDAVAVVELREGAGAEGRVVAESRTALKGRQVPVAFELSVDRAKLVAGARHSLRGAIVVGGRPAWATEPAAIDPSSAAIDVGLLRLARAQPLAFASTLVCGDRSVTVGHVGATMRMEAGDESFDLRPVRSASGARYEAAGDPSTSFWSKGDRATVVVHGQAWPECVPERAPSLPYRATGNEPGWRLDITARTMTLLADDGRTRIEAPTPLAEPGEGFTRFRAPAAGVGLVATIFERRCADSMTGMPYPDTVSVAFAGRTLNGCGGDPATLLRGDEWVVEDLRGGGVVDRSRPTLAFGADGRVSGRGSCNRFTASYALTGEGLTISRPAATMMACAPALMQQERLFFDLLAQVRRFTIEPTGALVLHAADGGTITARRP